jgi:putative transposase
MHSSPSIFAQLLQPLHWPSFKSIVARHDGDAYDKSFGSRAHLVAMIYAQMSGANSLRGLATGFNAHAPVHRQLGAVPVHRSTLADANNRRPVAVFAEVFAALATSLGRKLQAQGRAIIRILDATPIPLGQLFACASWNGRIKGFKLHLAFDPACERPQVLAITKATVNDITPAHNMPLERGVLYVFDKGYCSFDWWTNIAQNGAFFITRPKANMRWESLKTRPLKQAYGDGFTVLADTEVTLASKGDSKLPMRLRLITIKTDKGKTFTVLTNDMRRSAATIAALYKQRWQIELLFRWLKQHLKLKTFLGRSENAIRLQIIAAMIAYVLIKLAAHKHRTTLLALRFAELISLCLFEQRSFAAIARPKRRQPTQTKPRITRKFRHD